jgi:hypothetical protein
MSNILEGLHVEELKLYLVKNELVHKQYKNFSMSQIH